MINHKMLMASNVSTRIVSKLISSLKSKFKILFKYSQNFNGKLILFTRAINFSTTITSGYNLIFKKIERKFKKYFRIGDSFWTRYQFCKLKIH